MKVYLVIEEWCFDYDNGVDISVFADKEKAIDNLNKKIKKENDKNSNYDIEEIGENSYSGYVSGEYSMNHTNIYLEIKDVL